MGPRAGTGSRRSALYAGCAGTCACNDGGTRERVPPASDTILLCARDRSRTAETLGGSVHKSPVRPLPHAPKLKCTKIKFED
jgi:hypothetical protein